MSGFGGSRVRGVYKSFVGAIMRGARGQRCRASPGSSRREKTKALAGLEKDLLGDGDADALVAMPAKGLPAKEVELKVAALRGKEASKSAGEKRWGGIYHEQESELTRTARVGGVQLHERALPGRLPVAAQV